MQCRIAFASPVDSRSRLPQSVQKIKEPITDILPNRRAITQDLFTKMLLVLGKSTAGDQREVLRSDMDFFLSAQTTAIPAQAVWRGSKMLRTEMMNEYAHRELPSGPAVPSASKLEHGPGKHTIDAHSICHDAAPSRCPFLGLAPSLFDPGNCDHGS